MMDLMVLMNYNLHNRRNGNNSMLGEIQTKICGMFSSISPSVEQQEMFEANLVGSPNIFDEPEKYASVSNVYGVFNNYKQSMVQETQMTR